MKEFKKVKKVSHSSQYDIAAKSTRADNSFTTVTFCWF